VHEIKVRVGQCISIGHSVKAHLRKKGEKLTFEVSSSVGLPPKVVYDGGYVYISGCRFNIVESYGDLYRLGVVAPSGMFVTSEYRPPKSRGAHPLRGGSGGNSR
jgi:hypothetical protein